VRADPDLKEAVDNLLERKKITQQASINAMFRWLLLQDDMLQSIVLGQVTPETAEEVLILMLERLGESADRKAAIRDAVEVALGPPLRPSGTQSRESKGSQRRRAV